MCALYSCADMQPAQPGTMLTGKSGVCASSTAYGSSTAFGHGACCQKVHRSNHPSRPSSLPQHSLKCDCNSNMYPSYGRIGRGLGSRKRTDCLDEGCWRPVKQAQHPFRRVESLTECLWAGDYVDNPDPACDPSHGVRICDSLLGSAANPHDMHRDSENKDDPLPVRGMHISILSMVCICIA